MSRFIGEIFGNKIDGRVFLIAKHRALPGGSSGALHRPDIAARWYVFSANGAALIASPPQVRTQDGFVRRRNGFAVANVLVVASRDDGLV